MPTIVPLCIAWSRASPFVESWHVVLRECEGIFVSGLKWIEIDPLQRNRVKMMMRGNRILGIHCFGMKAVWAGNANVPIPQKRDSPSCHGKGLL